MTGSHEVRGSNPLRSTNLQLKRPAPGTMGVPAGRSLPAFLTEVFVGSDCDLENWIGGPARLLYL
jgi:hypothetical protein